MAQSVRVHVSLVLNLGSQAGQSTEALAAHVQARFEDLSREKGVVEDVRVVPTTHPRLPSTMPSNDDSETTDDLLHRESPPTADEPHSTPRAFDLRSGPRSVSDPDGIASPAATRGLARAEYSPPDAYLSKKEKKTLFRREATRAGYRGGRVLPARNPRHAKVERNLQQGDFKHDFENPGFNRRVRKDGISAALGPQHTQRMKKTMARRRCWDEMRRWAAHGDVDADKKVELLSEELASAFDFNADPAKDKGKVKETRLAEAVVRGGLDD